MNARAAFLTIGCEITVAQVLLDDSVLAERMMPIQAERTLTRVAKQEGCELLPETIEETGREALSWQNTGRLDEAGEPVQHLLPLKWAPEGTRPDAWLIRFRASAASAVTS